MSIGVEEAGVLVGLALVFDRVRDIGRPKFCFIGSGSGTYHQLLVADNRHDVTTLLWERLLSSGRDIDLASVPEEIGKEYLAVAPSALVLEGHSGVDLIDVPLNEIDSNDASHSRSARTISSPTESVDLLTRPVEAVRWGSGAPRSQEAAFFASTVDVSARTGRLTLHVVDGQDGLVDGVLVLHGSRTSVVWRHVGRPGRPMDPTIRQSAMAAAAERGSRRILWPESCGEPGRPFLLSDVVQAREKGGLLGEVTVLARSIGRSIKSYGTS
jgi:hypothetical protein